MRLFRLLASLDQIAEAAENFPFEVRLPIEQAYAALSKAAALTASSGMTLAVRDLPADIQKALKSVGYGRRDISVSTGTQFRLQQGGSDGRRSFTTIVNLKTGQYKTEMGSWGGANMFTQTLTDDDNTPRPLPPDMAVIRGSLGGSQPVYATILVHPSSLAPLLPSKNEGGELSLEEQKALEAIAGLISSARKREFEDNNLGIYGPTNQYVVSLAEKGMVKVAANGGITVTTAGKNQRRQQRGY